MSAKNVWTALATGCLVTMLLPTGVARAQSPMKADFGLGSIITLEGLPAAAASTNDTTLWFRKSFVLVPPDGTSPLKTTHGAPSKVNPAKAPLAAPPVPVPGTVQNVHRVDNG